MSHDVLVRKVLADDGEDVELMGWRVDCTCGWGSDWERLYRKESLAREAAETHLRALAQLEEGA